MLSFLLIIAFIIIYRFFLKSFYREEGYLRKIFFKTSFIWGILLVLSTEVLSLCHLISFIPLLIFWSIICLVFLVRIFNPPQYRFPVPALKQIKLSASERIILIITILIVSAVGLTAWMAPPNSWDALNYHMSRVMFWKQNHSVEHYPTPEFRQLFFQPFTGYVLLQFQILSDSDRWANLVSWFSMIGCLMGSSYITLLFGGSRKAQLLTAFFTATIPTGIVEASGVRIDWVLAYWMICFIAFLIAIGKRGDVKDVFGAAVAFGLGSLTKGTFFLMIPVFFLWFIFICFRKFLFLKALRYLSIFCLIVLTINSGFFARNIQVSRQPLGPSILRKWGLTYDMSPALIASNIIRTVGYQLGTTIDIWDDSVVKLMYKLHEFFNINIVDERSTISKTPFSVPVSTHEDSVTNFVQTICILVAFAAMLIRGIRNKQWDLVMFIISISLAFCEICSSIRWTNHMTRYALPLLVLGGIVVSLFLDKVSKRKPPIFYILVFILTATSMPYVFKNNLRRLVSKQKQTVFNTPRLDQYFRNDSSLLEPYSLAVEQVYAMNCHNVGLYMGFNTWDYPLWIIFSERFKNDIRLEHLNISHLTPQKYPLGPFQPCAVVSVYYREDRIDFPAGESFQKIKDFNSTAVYAPLYNEQKLTDVKPNIFEWKL